jgi:hypothetical protein
MRWHPNMSLVVGGLASFTIGYVPALGVAIASFANKLVTSGGGIGRSGDDGGAMILAFPVGGPFFFAASDAGDGVVNRTTLSGDAKALLYTSGILQAGGVVLMGLGFALGKETPVRVAPMGSAAGVTGISVAIDRW